MPPAELPAPVADSSRSDRLRIRARRLAPFVSGALVALLGMGVLSAMSSAPAPLTKNDVDEAVADALASMTPAPAFSELVYEAVRPSLVLIQTKTGTGEEGADPDEGLGSGVVVNLDGDILTSLHVVDGADEIEVTFADGTQSTAEVVVRQPENDIAVVRASEPPTTLVPATLGNPAVRQGSEAYALGSPFGLTGSLSVGVISGVNRSFERPDSERVLHGLIQIDAAVNPGNSGGPLVDRNGHVIGIVTALVNPTEDDVFIGIGLAVPIDVAGGAVDMPPY